MRQLKSYFYPLFYYVFGELMIWLFYWCFQPDRFAREFETGSAIGRIKSSLRLLLPLFLIDTLLTLYTRIVLRFMFTFHLSHLMGLIVSVILASMAGVIFGLVAGILGLGLAGGINIGLTGGISFAFIVSIPYASVEAYMLAMITGGLIVACMINVAGRRAGNDVISGIIAGVVAGIIAGVTTNFVTGGNSVADMTVGSIIGMIGGIIASRRKVRPPGGAHTRSRSLIIITILTGIVLILSKGIWAAGILFALTFLIVFYRLLLYPISGFSTWKALQASQRRPSHVFTYLHRSSLYWDEYVYLPLPGLTQIFTIAIEQNGERALEEVAFSRSGAQFGTH